LFVITEWVRGDSGYDDIWDAWVEEGRAATFETLDEDDGGRMYKALNRDDTYPHFILLAGDGPTTLDTTDVDDDNELAGRQLGDGYEMTMPDSDGVKFWRGPRGKAHIKSMKDRPMEED
jgi:hypothetical protein